ncbi:MAG: hypothetical protein IKF96_07035 [Eggerthellaceae bacterium]|nr:hypothetical protein [Eggerthellaceae bacterium]
MRKISQYADIINLPHHVSSKHPHMSLYDRAAQFAPFAALKGYDDAVEETARAGSVSDARDATPQDVLQGPGWETPWDTQEEWREEDEL